MPRTSQRCEITHAQILFGVCPWCDVIIGNVRSEIPLRKALTQWYPTAVAEGIRSDDPMIRDTTVSGLSHGWQLDDEMLGVLCTALRHADRSLVARRNPESPLLTHGTDRVRLLERLETRFLIGDLNFEIKIIGRTGEE